MCLCIFRDWYEPRAALMQEEGSVISGLLVGINIIDCNFDLKGDSLDTWVSGKTCFQEKDQLVIIKDLSNKTALNC